MHGIWKIRNSSKKVLFKVEMIGLYFVGTIQERGEGIKIDCDYSYRKEEKSRDMESKEQRTIYFP